MTPQSHLPGDFRQLIVTGMALEADSEVPTSLLPLAISLLDMCPTTTMDNQPIRCLKATDLPSEGPVSLNLQIQIGTFSS